jgi:hypothetical protein
MSSYKVMPRRRDSGFKVEVITVDGIRHTLLGFETELEAVIWAEADKEIAAAGTSFVMAMLEY